MSKQHIEPEAQAIFEEIEELRKDVKKWKILKILEKTLMISSIVLLGIYFIPNLVETVPLVRKYPNLDLWPIGMSLGILSLFIGQKADKIYYEEEDV